MSKFKVGDLVVSTSWAANDGLLVVSALPGQRKSHNKEATEYYELTDIEGNFKAYHTAEMIRKLTKLERAMK